MQLLQLTEEPYTNAGDDCWAKSIQLTSKSLGADDTTDTKVTANNGNNDMQVGDVVVVGAAADC